MGLRVAAIGRKDDVGIKSKYGRISVMHKDTDLVLLVNKILEDDVGNCRAYITSDYFLKLICNNHPELLHKIPFTISSVETLKILTDKQATYEHARRSNILAPDTIGLEQYENLKSNSFPLILKWNETPIGIRIPFKTRIINDYAGAKAIASSHKSIAQFLILQQIIVGIDLSYAGFFDHGKEVMACVTRKHRQVPIWGGLGSYVSDYSGPKAEECIKSGRALAESLNVNGFMEVEFKLGEDEKLYLIEVNPRIWGWAKFLKLKFQNYHDVLLDPNVAPTVNPDFCKWFNLLRDLKALGALWRPEMKLRTLTDFIFSYRGTKIYDVFELKDPGPFFYQLYKGLGRGI